jgi:hypothetical protein
MFAGPAASAPCGCITPTLPPTCASSKKGGGARPASKSLCGCAVLPSRQSMPAATSASAKPSDGSRSSRPSPFAQLAVAIAILSVAPVRLANLTAIRLGTNLIKPNGPDSNYWLVFPDYDVKNRVPLEYPLEQYLTRLLDEYVHDFRPVLLRGRNDDWLFPGEFGGAKHEVCLSSQITKRIYNATGLRMTVHHFGTPPVPSFSSAGRASTSWSGDCSVTATCRPRSTLMSAWRTSRLAKSSARS